MKSKLAFLTILLLAFSFAFGGQTVPKVKNLPQLKLNSAAAMKPNGQYIISIWKDNRWQEAGRLSCDKFLREQDLDLSPFLAGADAPRVRITEQGQGAAHIDSVLLGGHAPDKALGADGARIMKKLSAKDDDLIDSKGRSFELTFPGKLKDATLKLAARIESASIGTQPVQFPKRNAFTRVGPNSEFYTYSLQSSAPPPDKVGSEEYLRAVGGREPFLQEFARTGSGHPAGTTYGWVSNDGKNLYVTLDFTLDNTYDGDKDYAKVYVRAGKDVKEFKVSVPETKWGTPHFTYTDKVAYEHKVYDFVIPLAELGLAPGAGEVGLAFALYGTAVASGGGHPSVAFDPDHRRYLLVYEQNNGENFDIYGRFIDIEGNQIPVPDNGDDWVVISHDLEDPPFPVSQEQFFPDVAYDSAAQRFLVVWEDYRNPPTSPEIYCQLVGAEGDIIGENFKISPDGSHEFRPALANDTVNHRFLAVWSRLVDFPRGDDILGQLVGTDGGLIGDELVISDNSDHQRVPDVAFDASANEYLVAFQQSTGINGETITQIKGQFVSAAGAPLFTDTDENFFISDEADDAEDPSIANDSINHRFLVVWSEWREVAVGAGSPPQGVKADRRIAGGKHLKPSLEKHTPHGDRTGRLNGRTDIFRPKANASPDGEGVGFILGQIVETNGGLLYEDSLWISNDEDQIEDWPWWLWENQYYPAVAFNEGTGQYLVVFMDSWRDEDVVDEYGELDTLAQVVSAEGERIGYNEHLDYCSYHDVFEEIRPAVAANPFCLNYLAVWPEYHDYVPLWEIYGPTDCLELPTVTTAAVTEITTTSAKSGGEVTSDGGAEVTERGVCWSTSGDPTIFDSHTNDGSGLGNFVSSLTGLSPNTLYHVRAYATNSVGTAYGHEKTFITQKQYVVQFVSGGGGSVQGTTLQYVPEGGNCTAVEARADAGHCFTNWTGTGGFAATSANPLTVTSVVQDMVITAHFGSLGLQVQVLTESAWIIQRQYGKITVTVDGLDSSLAVNYVIYRKKGGEAYQSIKEFSSADLQNNIFTYDDKFLENNVAYTYQVIAYSLGGQEIGHSGEVTVQ